MKHYISLEENRISYICGAMSGSGFKVIKADWTVLPKNSREDTLKRFIDKNMLSGKRVILALDSGILFSIYSLPKGNSRQTNMWVFNELKHSFGKTQDLVICSRPFYENPEGKGVRVLAYAIAEKDLSAQLGILRAAGLRCKHAFVLSNCMGRMLARLYPNRKLMILVEVEEAQIRIWLIESGFTVLARTTRLNVKHFCEKEAYGLLYDEISEQVSKAIQFLKGRNKNDEIEAIALATDFLADGAAAAKAIGENLSLPCTTADFRTELFEGVNPKVVNGCHHALAVMVQHRERRLDAIDLLVGARRQRARVRKEGVANSRKLLGIFVGLAWVGLFGFGLSLNIRNHMDAKTIRELRTYIENPEKQERYQQARHLIDERMITLSEQKLLTTGIGVVRSDNLLEYRHYLTIHETLTDSMQITGMRYERETGVYEVDLSADDPQQFPDFLDRLRATSVFVSVTYYRWEQITLADGLTSYRMTVVAELRKVVSDEAE